MLERRVIFHIDEMNKWNMVLKNADNLLNSVDGENIKIEILANGEAVQYYEKNMEKRYANMKALHHRCVKFVACNNALMSNGLAKDKLIEFVEVVPAGVLELVDKQHEGYAYIKP